MNKQKLLLIPLLLIILVGCAQAGPRPGQAGQANATAVSDVTPTPRPTRAAENSTTVVADGVIKAPQPVLALTFETSGRVTSLQVQVGDVVQVGDLLATLDDGSLQEAVTSTELQVAQAENSLAQSQLDLDRLLNWQPDALAVAQAEANLMAAEAQLARAEVQDAVASNSVTQANVSVAQAQRALENAQEAYDQAHDPGRDWELGSPFYADRLKAEREGAANAVQMAQEQLQVARANWALSAAGVNSDTAVSAQSSVVSAQLALDQAQRGPLQTEITAAELRVQQAEIALAQSQLTLSQAVNRLAQSSLVSPAAGTVLAVEMTVGALVGAGAPVVTLQNMATLEFHTSNLSERDLAEIAPGHRAVVTLKSYPNTLIEGTVLRIGLQAEGMVGDSAVFPVMIGLAGEGIEVRPGMTGRVEIIRSGN